MKYAEFVMPMASDLLHLSNRGLEAQVAKQIPKIVRRMRKAAIKRETCIEVACASMIEVDYLADIFRDYGYRVITDCFELDIYWNE
jgi:hypothetical protein